MAVSARFPGRTRQVHRKRKAVTCSRCGWTWVPYGRKRPARCANATCRSPYWDKPRREDRPSPPPREATP
jgi:hypothetical protein